MGMHVYWPATACVTLFVVGAIMLLLRYGPKYCKTRHVAFSDTQPAGRATESNVSDV